jgi:feruloyl esterase
MISTLLSYGASAQDLPMQACQKLAQLTLPGASVTMAETVPAGAFAVSSGDPHETALFKTLPAFCRVAVVAKPSPDSEIKIEVWMPAEHWNGKFQGLGNGGFAGDIDHRLMAIALDRGYATAATDTGHAGSPIDARWALNHPEKVIDFGYRGIHEMTRVAKTVVHEYYGENPTHSYFGACSNGGRQGLMEAQRYPEDYDGILAGAPANFWSHLVTGALWDAQALTSNPASYIPADKLPAIAAAVNAACDGKDGVKDGVINDPRECHFDPATLLCKAGESDKCLTEPQVIALKKLYAGAHDSQSKLIYPGFLPGAELGEQGWTLWIIGPAPGKALLDAFDYGYFADMVYDKPDWNYKDANLDQAVKAADDKTAKVLNATDPNLKTFASRGGKLILYHGWNDPAISALNSISYYDGVVSALGQNTTDSFMRLYIVPGMQHCGDGPGADSFGQPGARPAPDPQHNVQLVLEQWVEKNTAPSSLVASKYSGEYPSLDRKMSRPLCPYPQSAKYKGAGDTNEATNFACSAP